MQKRERESLYSTSIDPREATPYRPAPSSFAVDDADNSRLTSD